MGITTMRIRIFSTAGGAGKEVELLVDTGSLYTWIDKELLNSLGISSKGRKKFRTIDGKTVERDVAEAVLEYNGARATRIVVFAEPADAKVLGVDALEGLGFEIDPVNRTLRKIETFLAV